MTDQEEATPFVPVGPADMLKPGQATIIDIEDDSIVLANFEGDYYAIENRCSHDDGPLGKGRVVGCLIECPRHGAKFDVRDGSAESLPAFRPVSAFETRVNDGQVEVQYKKPEPAKWEDPRGFSPFA